MTYTEEQVQKLVESLGRVDQNYQSFLKTYGNGKPYKSSADEFLKHGFLRRIIILKRCIDNIYSVCPISQDRKLSNEKRIDVEINLHAFVINTYGCLDNLAWIWVKQEKIKEKIGKDLLKNEIGFPFNDSTKYKKVWTSFSERFQKYLNSREKWFKYIENFRHSLAHRIPLYIPPCTVKEKDAESIKRLEDLRWKAMFNNDFEELARLNLEIEKLEEFVPIMLHSYEEESPYIFFHAQIIADWNTVVEISKNFFEELDMISF